MPEQAAGQQPAAGWMKDPSGRHFGRYWDGKRWTDHVISPQTVPSVDPVNQPNGAAAPSAALEDRTGPASTPERPGSWKRDPSGRHASRYWDGRRWTDHVMSAERVPAIDRLPPGSVEPPRAEPAGTRVAPAAAPTKVMPASGVRAWARSAPWAVAVIVCGLVVIGVALTGRSSRPTKQGPAVTESVATTAPSVPALPGTTIPLGTQATVTVPGARADSGAPATTPATTPGTLSGSQSPVTSAPAADSPATVPRPAESTADPSMSTTS